MREEYIRQKSQCKVAAGADLVSLKNSKEASTVGKELGGGGQEDEVREVSWVVAGGNLLDHIQPCRIAEPLRKSAVTCTGLA